jgi:hypothetical protein
MTSHFYEQLSETFKLKDTYDARETNTLAKSASVPVVSEADNGIALKTQQILQIAGVLGSTVEDELAMVRSAWIGYQSTRERDAVYKYLTAVFETVSRWKKQNRAKTKTNQALAAPNSTKAIRTNEPFAVVIWCTSDPHRVDAKTRSKWSRALRYAERFKPDNQGLTQFIKSKGGVNACAAQWSGRLRLKTNY